MVRLVQPADHIAYDQYLALEAAAEQKHEYIDGLIVAMSGGTAEHGRLAAAMTGLLFAALRGSGCRVFSSDVRVRVEETNRAAYPDLSVVCGELRHASDDRHAITNPRVLVEVLSESTEVDDRGAKFAHYRRLDALKEYVLVSQSEPRVEVFRRTAAGWLLVEAGPGERVRLESLPGDVTLDVDELYADALPAEAPAPDAPSD